MKMQDDVKQLVEDGDATFEQIQLLKSQLVDVEANVTAFKKDFLSVNAKVLAQNLVTVSSNLNKSSVDQNQATNHSLPRKPGKFRLFVIFLNKTTHYFKEKLSRQMLRLLVALDQRQACKRILPKQLLHNNLPLVLHSVPVLEAIQHSFHHLRALASH